MDLYSDNNTGEINLGLKIFSLIFLKHFQPIILKKNYLINTNLIPDLLIKTISKKKKNPSKG